MIKFIICEDNLDTLERTSQTVTKSMMKYDIEYKVYKFPKYTNELAYWLIGVNSTIKKNATIDIEFIILTLIIFEYRFENWHLVG